MALFPLDLDKVVCGAAMHVYLDMHPWRQQHGLSIFHLIVQGGGGMDLHASLHRAVVQYGEAVRPHILGKK